MVEGIEWGQLLPVADGVCAGVIPYDPRYPMHEHILRDASTRFLGSLAIKHGAEFSNDNVEQIVAAANAQETMVSFIYVDWTGSGQGTLVGMCTGASTFGAEWDNNNKLTVVPVYHGEDLFIDADAAKKFRSLTTSEQKPNGIGLGSWVVGEQLRLSVSNPDWVFAGRDNEHAPDNQAIMGVMKKYGAVLGTEQDSAVLQLDRLDGDIKNSWGVPVLTESLQADPLETRSCPNNFMTRWESSDGFQQIAVIFRKLPPTSDAETVVWTKIKSNHGNLPEKAMLKEVMSSLIMAGSKEIESPERCWGDPRDSRCDVNSLSHVFSWPMPVMHMHLFKERGIIQVLKEMGAAPRRYGSCNMVSGFINPREMPNQEALFGRMLPAPTSVSSIETRTTSSEPVCSFGPVRPPNSVAQRCAFIRMPVNE